MNKRQIEKRVDYWKNRLNLHEWEIVVAFDKTQSKIEDERYISVAHADSKPEYLMATIIFNPKRLQHVDDETIVHELLHIVTAEVHGYVFANLKKDKWFDYFNERTICRLARIIANRKL